MIIIQSSTDLEMRIVGDSLYTSQTSSLFTKVGKVNNMVQHTNRRLHFVNLRKFWNEILQGYSITRLKKTWSAVESSVKVLEPVSYRRKGDNYLYFHHQSHWDLKLCKENQLLFSHESCDQCAQNMYCSITVHLILLVKTLFIVSIMWLVWFSCSSAIVKRDNLFGTPSPSTLIILTLREWPRMSYVTVVNWVVQKHIDQPHKWWMTWTSTTQMLHITVALDILEARELCMHYVIFAVQQAFEGLVFCHSIFHARFELVFNSTYRKGSRFSKFNRWALFTP